MRPETKYDVIIVGGSYSGMAAGMALGRALRKTLIIDSGEPCNKQTPHSHNFLTNDGKTPEEISGLAREQVANYSSVTYLEDLATIGNKINGGFEVRVET
ncbi:MAG TPA: NAD(P)/FAD-dependent oxidoreductase, partial [Flavilitoribacter sp.]|nr:NAD(P)/FAD-dependent oxidoreductase [Flavilitoribacter sp.]